MTRRAALFGGTFDPVHRAHLALAQAALAELAVDEVRWVPTGQPWQKQRRITAAVHRQTMLQLALAGEPRFVLDPIELARSGPSYTLDTVLALQAAHPHTRWTLLLGQDQYAGLHSWHRWRELLALVDLAVAARPGAALQADAEVARQPVQRLALPPMDISATDIRRRVAAGADISALVPPEVAGYIARHGLYLDEPARS
jgi:nicotinate-nucleotide adenylyltransferase